MSAVSNMRNTATAMRVVSVAAMLKRLTQGDISERTVKVVKSALVKIVVIVSVVSIIGCTITTFIMMDGILNSRSIIPSMLALMVTIVILVTLGLTGRFWCRPWYEYSRWYRGDQSIPYEFK